jgi:hypothetical protein
MRDAFARRALTTSQEPLHKRPTVLGNGSHQRADPPSFESLRPKYLNGCRV